MLNLNFKKYFSSVVLKGIQSIKSNELPSAIGPYSQGIRVNLAQSDLIFCSGALGVDKKGNIVSDDIEKQTLQAIENLQTLLEYLCIIIETILLI
jgi:enamine deaminase RidA (YjgF/YER057c/UK114 family)